MAGKVYLVGAGPGDPGLLTRKGEACLRKADVVVHDRLIGNKILGLAREGAELIYVGKASSDHSLPQDQINELLYTRAAEGKTVVRLKGGDPCVFGRGGEEALYLAERGIPFEVVPGVTSAVAAAAYAGIPVTHREFTSSLALVTGHEKPDKLKSAIDWQGLAASAGTIAFYMGIENLAEIARNLIEAGRDESTPVALIRWGTLPCQEVLTGTLADIGTRAAECGFKPPAIIVVGEVVRLREKLDWFSARPLKGRRIVVTRSREQASRLADRLEELGAEVIELPTIKIKKEDDLFLLHRSFAGLYNYDWLVFTSANAVHIFFDELLGCGYDARALGRVRVAAMGPATAEALRQRSINADLVPEEYRAEALAELLADRVSGEHRVLMPRARGAREVLPAILRQRGAHVDEIPVYEAVPADVDPEAMGRVMAGDFDIITFTSSSTVRNFVGMVGDNLAQVMSRATVACIGPVTADTARQLGINPAIVASEYTIDGLISSLL